MLGLCYLIQIVQMAKRNMHYEDNISREMQTLNRNRVIVFCCEFGQNVVIFIVKRAFARLESMTKQLLTEYIE